MCGASYIISLFTRHLAEPQNAQFYHNSSRGNSSEEQAQGKVLGLPSSMAGMRSPTKSNTFLRSTDTVSYISNHFYSSNGKISTSYYMEQVC